LHGVISAIELQRNSVEAVTSKEFGWLLVRANLSDMDKHRQPTPEGRIPTQVLKDL
jgi:hypothetical protein